jgi:IS1 family transposase
LFTGKDLTYPIEQSNSDVRNQAARFARRHKSSSRALDMVEITLKIVNKFRDKNFLQQMCVGFIASFG